MHTKGDIIHTSLIFNHDNTAVNHIRANACLIILSDPIACSCVAINYNFGTQLICLRAGLVIWFRAHSLDFPYPLISFALAHQQHQHMLSHPRPRAHLSPVLLIPPVVASASLTLTQHAAAALIPSYHSLHLSFSGLEPLNLSTLHLTSRFLLVALLNMNTESLLSFSHIACQIMPA